jgi:hypothetical protein
MTRPIDEPWANLPPEKEKVDWDAVIDAEDDEVDEATAEPPPKAPDSPGG